MASPSKSRKGSTSSRSGPASPHPLIALGARGALWGALALSSVAVLAFGGAGVHALFVSANPHFTVREIEVELGKGELAEDAVLAQLGVTPGQDNLFRLDLGDLRQSLIDDPLIQTAELRRVLPATLRVTVYGRSPVAQLLRNGGRLIDAEGIVLPRSSKRETLSLPVITGIPALEEVPVGAALADDMTHHALQLLHVRETAAKGHMLDIDFIQLDRSRMQMRVFLRGKTALLIRDGCQLNIPVDRVQTAIARAIEIIETRSRARQPTGFMDLSFDRVPVRP